MRPVNPSLQAERCQQILDAALVCFREKGFHGAGMSMICKRARMSPGHVYHYFKSKEDLIEAIIEVDNERSNQKFRELLGGEDTLQALLDGIDHIWHKVDEGLRGVLDAEILAEATRNPRIADMIRAREEHFRGMFGDLLKAAQERGNISSTVDPYGFATMMIEIVSALTISDDAGTGIDRRQMTETLRFMVRRCLEPGK